MGNGENCYHNFPVADVFNVNVLCWTKSPKSKDYQLYKTGKENH